MKSMKRIGGMFFILLGVCLQGMPSQAAQAPDDYYTEPPIFTERPNPGREYDAFPVGVTGIEACIKKGVVVTVETTQPSTPSQGKLFKGDILLVVNNVPLKGKNPYVALGNALTKAEATDGVLTFDVQSGKEGALKQVTLQIPVLGTYSKSFPLNCEKSKKIIQQAAVFYSAKERLKGHTMLNALGCLFLLSTGDDQYIPRVKAYFSQFIKTNGDCSGVGDHSWYNGYNGVACAEYYLRTGDQSVLPLLQHYCDDAKKRQHYGLGWGHWGHGVNPAYEAGGGMQHSAGNQMLLTLMLGKVCGVQVDDKTLEGALKHWYRFVGHGAIPLSDQRYWSIFRSAGRDGATAAVMHIATGAKGDVAIYQQAKEYLAYSAITSWPAREYNWEVIWESLASAYMVDTQPALYRQTQEQLRWNLDLRRQASGAFAAHEDHATMDTIDSGISLALNYTAPLKTLQITGAPRSKYAKNFTLPERLWGNESDRAFLSAKHHPDFYTYGAEESIHIPYWQLPVRLQYSPKDVKGLSLETMQKNVRHARCEIRAGAAKALCMNKQYGELEKLLRDPDPRLRRAALDGINDNHPWFTEPVVGKQALKPEAYTPAMLEAITAMLSNPQEAWFVVDGALNALNHAPVAAIQSNIPNILPWTKHEDWWLREAAFMALMGLQQDEALFVQVLPTLIEVMTREYHYNPHLHMVQQFTSALAFWKNDSRVGRMIIAGFSRAALESTVLPDIGPYPRSCEGTANIIEVALASIQVAPEAAAELAHALATGGRLETLDTPSLMKIVSAPDGHLQDRFIGLYPALSTLAPQQKSRLTDILYDVFRPTLIKRLPSVDEQNHAKLIDLILDLTQLKQQVEGWHDIGTPAPEARVWRYTAFDPLSAKDRVPPLVWERFRKAELPAGLAKWMMPEFDDSAWKSGATPIGKGEFKAHGHGLMWTATPKHFFKNNSDWGEGEFLLMRTTFDVADLTDDFYRIKLLTAKGYTIYLNGKQIKSYPWSAHFPRYEKIILGDAERKHLKKGKNTLAVYCIAGFEKDKDTDALHAIGQMDLTIQGLKREDVQ
jgi:Family of unknown function (DUF6288)